MRKKWAGVCLFLLAFSATGWAQQNPRMGTWKANYDKTSPPATPDTTRPSYVVTREPYGKDGEKWTGDQVTAQGEKIHAAYSAEYDGKDYPVTGDPRRDTVSIKRVGANALVQTYKKDGKVTGVNIQLPSRDGRTSYTLSRAVDASGQLAEIPNITVWDKQ